MGQRPKFGWDPGSQPRDLASQPIGSGSKVFFIESKISIQDNNENNKTCSKRDFLSFIDVLRFYGLFRTVFVSVAFILHSDTMITCKSRNHYFISIGEYKTWTPIPMDPSMDRVQEHMDQVHGSSIFSILNKVFLEVSTPQNK